MSGRLAFRRTVSIATIAVLALAGHALGWGATGHRLIGRLAITDLPTELPRSCARQAAVETIGELSREPDRWKDAGKVHDLERDPAHFLDLGDDGRIFGGPAIAQLPPARPDYDAALRAVGVDSWKAGFLPYAIVDGWQQLAKDLAYWRVDAAAAHDVANRAHRAWFAADEACGARLCPCAIWAPCPTMSATAVSRLHVSLHYNGWGPYPNPEGFTQSKVHAPFEGAFVRAYVTAGAVQAAMTPYRDCQCPIEARAADYLATTNRFVKPFYQMQKDGGLEHGDAHGRAFAAARLAAGASELRDEIIDAWRASAAGSVGWPAVKVADVMAGRVDPFELTVWRGLMRLAGVIDGRARAQALRERVARETAELVRTHGVTPGLAVVLVGDDPASQIYVRSKGEQTVAAGMHSVTHRLAGDVSIEAVFAVIAAPQCRSGDPWHTGAAASAGPIGRRRGDRRDRSWQGRRRADDDQCRAAGQRADRSWPRARRWAA